VYPPAQYSSAWKASGLSPDAFAAKVCRTRRAFALAVLEHIGLWPSSEPEFAALQRRF